MPKHCICKRLWFQYFHFLFTDKIHAKSSKEVFRNEVNQALPPFRRTVGFFSNLKITVTAFFFNYNDIKLIKIFLNPQFFFILEYVYLYLVNLHWFPKEIVRINETSELLKHTVVIYGDISLYNYIYLLYIYVFNMFSTYMVKLCF